jgi:cyclopropane fatty-acyl-phospholipid synthase-like methyltransferase
MPQKILDFITHMSTDQVNEGFGWGDCVELVQTGLRNEIVDAWGIRPGATILEIGWGQGDLTAVPAQGQVEAFRNDNSSNIRTPITKDALEGLLRNSDWEEVAASTIDFSGL